MQYAKDTCAIIFAIVSHSFHVQVLDGIAKAVKTCPLNVIVVGRLQAINGLKSKTCAVNITGQHKVIIAIVSSPLVKIFDILQLVDIMHQRKENHIVCRAAIKGGRLIFKGGFTISMTAIVILGVIDFRGDISYLPAYMDAAAFCCPQLHRFAVQDFACAILDIFVILNGDMIPFQHNLIGRNISPVDDIPPDPAYRSQQGIGTAGGKSRRIHSINITS